MAKREVHFFDDDELFAAGAGYAPFHERFRVRRRQRIVGECTPIYLYWRPAMERIWNYNPEIKLIVILRNPIIRAFSHWNMERIRKNEPLDFLDAIEAEPRRAAAVAPRQLRRYSYVGRGLYSAQIERVMTFFAGEQVKFVRYEKFHEDQQTTVNEITEFLGAKPTRVTRREEQNVFPYRRQLTPDERISVAEKFREDIPRIEKSLGWDCSDWKQ